MNIENYSCFCHLFFGEMSLLPFYNFKVLLFTKRNNLLLFHNLTRKTAQLLKSILVASKTAVIYDLSHRIGILIVLTLSDDMYESFLSSVQFSTTSGSLFWPFLFIAELKELNVSIATNSCCDV